MLHRKPAGKAEHFCMHTFFLMKPQDNKLAMEDVTFYCNCWLHYILCLTHSTVNEFMTVFFLTAFQYPENVL